MKRIPSTDEGQRSDDSALVDASQIDIKAMGQFSMGGFGGQNDKTDSQNTESENTEPSENAEPSDKTDTEPAQDEAGSVPQKPDEQTGESSAGASESAGIHRQRPSFSGMPGQSANQQSAKSIIILGICLAAMIAALIIVKLYKRRR